MEITEVRIKLMDGSEDRLRGFCSVTFDDAFVVRDLKIIEGNNGPFVAMPSRKLTSNCHKCRTKNHLRASYCNHCGARLRDEQIPQDAGGRAKLYADIAHPVNAECREMIQSRVIEELEKELELSQQPGYFSRYDDGYDHSSDRNSSNNDRSSNQHVDESDSDKMTRVDAAHGSDQTAHAPGPHKSPEAEDQNISSNRSNPPHDTFGQGIFDE